MMSQLLQLQFDLYLLVLCARLCFMASTQPPTSLCVVGIFVTSTVVVVVHTTVVHIVGGGIRIPYGGSVDRKLRIAS
jgi:hypothetical protein